jgi:hypothetical protein
MQAIVSRFAPFAAGAPFAVMLVEFETLVRRADLREALRWIDDEICKRAWYGGIKPDEIIFVCAMAGYQGLCFVRFEHQIGGQPKMSVFGWDRNRTDSRRRLLDYHLPALQLPSNYGPVYDWSRARWRAAWDIGRVNRAFCREYRVVFADIEQIIALANPMLQHDWRGYTQRLFSRLMFRQFLAQKSFASDGKMALTPLIPQEAYEHIHCFFARWKFTIVENTELDVEVAVDPEMMGKVFEELVVGRHKSGSYYTPRGIVAFMCRMALKHYLEVAGIPAGAAAKLVDDHSTSNLREQDFGVALTALKRVRVIDPACGSGAYLLGMLHELVELHRRLCRLDAQSDLDAYRHKMHIIRHNLYGVDRDASAVEIVRLRLQLSLAADSEVREPLREADFNVRQGDSLGFPILQSVPPIGATDTKMRVTMPLAGQHSFDIVLANPPYLSIKHGFGREDRASLKHHYRTASGQFDAYALFLEHALLLLGERGCYAYLVPKSILTNSNMLPVRKLLQSHGLIAIADPGLVFAAAVEPIILIGQKGNRAQEQVKIYPQTYFRDGRGTPDGARIEDLVTPVGSWNITPAIAACELAARLNHLPRLGDLYEITRGVECGKKDAAVCAEPRPDAAPLLRGEDLQRYQIRFAGCYIVHGADATKFKTRALYEAPKVLVRRVANQLIAAVDRTGYHVLNTLYVARPKPGSTLTTEYVCALLNSQVVNAYFHAVFVNDDRLFPYIRTAQLAQLPIALPTAQQEAAIVSLVRRISDDRPEQMEPLRAEIDRIIQQIFAS